MKHVSTRRAFLALLLAACEAPRGPRCAHCGMRLRPEHAHWRAGARTAAGVTVDFDTPACLFRYGLGHGPLRDPWVTEYYARAGVQADARRLRYAVGSDLTGPMGPDLVPLDPAREGAFTRDHRPRVVVAFEAVTAALLERL